MARKPSAWQTFLIGMARSDDIDRVLARRYGHVVHSPKWKTGLGADHDAFARDLQALRGDRMRAEQKLIKPASKTKLGGGAS